MENTDRLSDDFWTQKELRQMSIDVLNPDRYSKELSHIVIYHLQKNGVDTGLVLITVVESILDVQDAIDSLWVEAGITALVGEYSEESVLNHIRVEAIYLLLQKYRYNGKAKLPGYNKVFKYQEWFVNLL